jgi:hypothetical protein
VPNLTEARKVAHGIDDVMRRLAFRFVNHQRAVKRRRARLSWHASKFLDALWVKQKKNAGRKPGATQVV